MSKRTARDATLNPISQQKLVSITESIRAGKLKDADNALQPLIRKYPAAHQVCHVAAGLCSAQRQPEKALFYAQRAVELAPDIAEYQTALGGILIQQDKCSEAIKPLTKALDLQPNLPHAIVHMGTARMQLGEISEARGCFSQVLAMNPADRDAANNLALLESDIANAHRAVEITEEALKHIPQDPLLLDALCMFACYDDQLNPEQVFEFHKRFGQSVQSRVRIPARYPNTPDPEKRIRIGFVSPDLRRHSIAYFVYPIIKHLNRDRFEVYCYHTSRHTDAMSDTLRDACDVWRECHTGIAGTHKQIAQDQVDILIELNGHFSGNVLPIFASKPTPVSATMIGYANTTGLESITARIIDDVTDPAPQADAIATEALIRVPGCFLCYQPPSQTPDVREPTEDRPFTFGSFNDLRKMSPSTFKAWAQILKACPQAHLLLKTSRLSDEEVRADITNRLENLGIEPTRIKLVAYTESLQEHLDLYNSIDIALDTFPYTGTTTTCEAMHMGVPTITLLGQSHAGRVSASLNRAVGIEQYNADSVEQYTELAVQAHAEGKRSTINRSQLRDQLAASSLCDQEGYAAKIADVFDSLWRQWCAATGGR